MAGRASTCVSSACRVEHGHVSSSVSQSGRQSVTGIEAGQARQAEQGQARTAGEQRQTGQTERTRQWHGQTRDAHHPTTSTHTRQHASLLHMATCAGSVDTMMHTTSITSSLGQSGHTQPCQVMTHLTCVLPMAATALPALPTAVALCPTRVTIDTTTDHPLTRQDTAWHGTGGQAMAPKASKASRLSHDTTDTTIDRHDDRQHDDRQHDDHSRSTLTIDTDRQTDRTDDDRTDTRSTNLQDTPTYDTPCNCSTR